MLVVDAAFDTPLITPFDNSTVTPIKDGTPSEIYNVTTGEGLVFDVTNTTQDNSTFGGGGLLTIFDTVLFPLTILWTFIKFITGGFIFEFLGLLGMPSIFIFVLQGVVGLLIARMVIYWILGR
ncbi:MAG: hypothetical protein GTO02_09985 [Candidatus Dadabacteria bacterium]|nr:hypothetical protein [Candidatus Dadabacteria bacterium]